MADTAALVVALSAQLSKFEKDMKGAVDIADKRTREIENSFTRMNKEIESQVSGLAQGFANRLGPIGSILSAIGPVGLGAAAALGTLAAAFFFLSDKVEKFATSARALKEFSETTGIAVEQLKALSIVGTEVGLDSEKTERGITKLAIAVQELRKGQGPLFDVLLKINPELLKQVAAAKDVTEAIDLLSEAYKKLTDRQRFQLSTAVGGARNTAVGRVLGALPEGGLTAAGEEQLRKGFDPALIERVTKLRQEIEAIRKQTENIWGSMFAVENLEAEKQVAEFLNRIANAIKEIKNAGPINLDLKVADLQQKIDDINKAEASGTVTGLRLAVMIQDRARFERQLAQALEERTTKEKEASAAQQAAADVPLPTARSDTGAVNAEREAEAIEKRKAALVGNIAIMKLWTDLTEKEALQLKQAEVELKGLETPIVAKRGVIEMNAFTLAQRQAIEALRERLGIATEEQIAEGRLEKLRDDARIRGLSDNEVLRATNIIMKEAKEAADQLAVRRSYLPGLKQLELDAANVRKSFDQLAVRTFDTLGDGFADIVLKTKTLSEAFKSMTDSILRDLLRLLFRQAVTGPLAGAIGGLFAPAGKQSGGPVSAGAPYVVGEHGPELFVPSSSGKIIPNVSHGGSGGGTMVEINNYVAADTETKQQRQDGPNGERIIIDIVKKAQARGQLDDVNRGRFALRPAKVR